MFQLLQELLFSFYKFNYARLFDLVCRFDLINHQLEVGVHFEIFSSDFYGKSESYEQCFIFYCVISGVIFDLDSILDSNSAWSNKDDS